MPRARGSRGRGKRPPAPQPLPTKEKGYSKLRKISEWSLGIATIIGMIAGLVIFLPRPTVEPGGQIDPSSPYPIPFTITNTGVIPLTNVQPMLGICEFWTGEPMNLPDRCGGSLQSRLAFQFWFVKKLAMDEKHTIRLDDLFHVVPPAKFGGADISIVVRYQPWFMPFKREKEFRFVTRVERDGKLSWLRRPVDK